ncbi:hypothetical protein Mapa_003603 [Marchantia paleacea]|nr:hypothetical protein Mapa_003603 [Marchantia paleacea]
MNGGTYSVLRTGLHLCSGSHNLVIDSGSSVEFGFNHRGVINVIKVRSRSLENLFFHSKRRLLRLKFVSCRTDFHLPAQSSSDPSTRRKIGFQTTHRHKLFRSIVVHRRDEQSARERLLQRST